MNLPPQPGGRRLSIAEIRATVSMRSQVDNLSWIRDATNAHRTQHGCWAYPYADGTLLGAIAAVLNPARMLELGTAAGYTACWWAQAGAIVTTIEGDTLHQELALKNISAAGLDDSVTVHPGQFLEIMDGLSPEFDLIFFDGYALSGELLSAIQRLLRPEGTMILTNLELGPGNTRGLLQVQSGWQTDFLEDLAICWRLDTV